MIYVEYIVAILNGFVQVRRNIIKSWTSIYGITE